MELPISLRTPLRASLSVFVYLATEACSGGLSSSSRSTDDPSADESSPQSFSGQGDQAAVPADVAGAFLACAGKSTATAGEIDFGCTVLTSSRHPFRFVVPNVSYEWDLNYQGKEVVTKPAASLVDESLTAPDRVWTIDRSRYSDLALLKPQVKLSLQGKVIAQVSRVETAAMIVGVVAALPPQSLPPSGEHIVFLLSGAFANPADEYPNADYPAFLGYTYRCQQEALTAYDPSIKELASTFFPFMASLGAEPVKDLELLAKRYPGRVKNVKGETVAEAGEMLRLRSSSDKSTPSYSYSISNKLNVSVNGVRFDTGASIKFWTGLEPPMVASSVTSTGQYSCGKWDNHLENKIAAYGTIASGGAVVLHGGGIGCNPSNTSNTSNTPLARAVCISNPAK